jgi:hypothetical protein
VPFKLTVSALSLSTRPRGLLSAATDAPD